MTVEAIEVQKDETQVLTGVLAGAEIEQQIATARKYPRDVVTFKARLGKLALMDRQTAASCFYVLPRAGKNIDGPSVRLAELALSCYCNVIAQGDVSHEDGKYIYAVGMARDIENNIAVRVTVRRRITDKNGKRYNDDMIGVTANAAVSIALRNAIFKVVPAAYIQPVFQQCKEFAAGKASDLNEAKQRAIEYFTEMGVSEKQLLAALRRKSVEDITKADVITMHGFATAIRDGDASVETIFGSDSEGISGSEDVEKEQEPDDEPKTQATEVKPPKNKKKSGKSKKTESEMKSNIFD